LSRNSTKKEIFNLTDVGFKVVDEDDEPDVKVIKRFLFCHKLARVCPGAEIFTRSPGHLLLISSMSQLIIELFRGTPRRRA
jgi:hypothetical protein